MKLALKVDGSQRYSVISMTVSLLPLRISKYVRYLTFMVWALDMTFSTVCYLPSRHWPPPVTLYPSIEEPESDSQ